MKTQRYLIKVCGMMQGDNIREIEALGVDLIGFNFYPKSPRCLSQMPDYLPQQARRVGVFVNQPKEEVTMYADRFGLDYLQLHGTESPGYCRTLQAAGFHLIKVFSIARAKDLENNSTGACSATTTAGRLFCSAEASTPIVQRPSMPSGTPNWQVWT